MALHYDKDYGGYSESEFYGTIKVKITNPNVLFHILYESGLYQIGPKQIKKRRVMTNETDISRLGMP